MGVLKLEEIQMLNEELIYLDLEADNSEELLSLLSDKLYEKGYVKESFKKKP